MIQVEPSTKGRLEHRWRTFPYGNRLWQHHQGPSLKAGARSTVVLPLVLIAFLSAPSMSRGTSIVDFTTEDLIRWSHACLKVTVIAEATSSQRKTLRLNQADAQGNPETLLLAVDEIIYGEVPEQVAEISIPLGLQGAPSLRPGHTYLVFVNFSNHIEPILGHKWGTYEIYDDKVLDFAGRPVIARNETARSGNVVETRLRVSGGAEPSLRYPILKVLLVSLRAGLIRDGFVPLTLPLRP